MKKKPKDQQQPIVLLLPQLKLSQISPKLALHWKPEAYLKA